MWIPIPLKKESTFTSNWDLLGIQMFTSIKNKLYCNGILKYYSKPNYYLCVMDVAKLAISYQ